VLYKSLPSVCVSVCVSLLSLQGNIPLKFIPPFGARQRLGKHFPAATNTRNRRIVGRVIFYSVRVISKESLWVFLYIPLSLLGKNLLMTFPRQRRIIRGVVFYTVIFVSKESRRLVLPRTSCSISDIYLFPCCRLFFRTSLLQLHSYIYNSRELRELLSFNIRIVFLFVFDNSYYLLIPYFLSSLLHNASSVSQMFLMLLVY
jgi:hypothetical protein